MRNMSDVVGQLRMLANRLGAAGLTLGETVAISKQLVALADSITERTFELEEPGRRLTVKLRRWAAKLEQGAAIEEVADEVLKGAARFVVELDGPSQPKPPEPQGGPVIEEPGQAKPPEPQENVPDVVLDAPETQNAGA